MKRFALSMTLLIIAFSISSTSFYSQQASDPKDALAKKMAEMSIEPDTKTVYKDETDKVIPRDEFMKFLKENSQNYTSKRVVKDGRVEEMKLAKLSPMEIEMRQRMFDKINESKLLKAESIGKRAADFTAKTLDGKSVSLSDF